MNAARVFMFTAAAAAVAGLLAPTGAAGQDTGARIATRHRAEIPESANLSPEDRGRSVIVAFAGCLVEYNPAGVTRFLKTVPETPEYAAQARRLASDECLANGSVKFDAGMLRGAVYAALYVKRFRFVGAMLRTEPVNYKADVEGVSGQPAALYLDLRDFADCVVRKDPEDSRTLVIGPIGSERERAALQSLAAIMGPCMPQTLTIRFNKASIAGLVAEVLYRASEGGS